MNSRLKLAIVSGFLAAFALHGGGVVQRRIAAPEPGSSQVPTLFADAAAAQTAAPSQARIEGSSGGLTPVEGAAPPPATPDPSEGSRNQGAGSFAAELLRLSGEADGVDRLWQAYKEKCGVRVSRRYDFGREWFSIWDRAAEPTITGPGCGEVPPRLRQAGEKVRRELSRACATAHQGPGTEIGMLRWHALQWPHFEEEQAEQPGRATASLPSSTRSAENLGAKRQGRPQP